MTLKGTLQDLPDRLNRLDSEHSRRAYRNDWTAWVDWLSRRGLDPLSATPAHVEQFLAWLHARKKSKATRARALSVIRSVYGMLVVENRLKTNPAREVRNIRVSQEPRTPWLDEDELRRLLQRPPPGASWVQQRDWLICATLVGTGLRRSEVARLRRDQLIRTAGGLVAQVRAKGGKVAYVSLPAWLSSEIDAWCDTQKITAGPIFPAFPRAARGVGPTTVRNAVKRAAERAGLDLNRSTPHAIRRSFATITGLRGVPLRDRQAALLHSQQATTERYDKAARLPQAAPGEVLHDLIGR